MTDPITNPTLETDENTDTFPTLIDPTLPISTDDAKLDHLMETMELPFGATPKKAQTVAEADEDSSRELISPFPSQDDIDAEKRRNKGEDNNLLFADLETLSDLSGWPIKIVEKNIERTKRRIEQKRVDKFLEKNKRVKEHLIANGIFEYTLADLHDIEKNLPEEKEGSIVPVPLDIERAEALVRNLLIGSAENGQVLNKTLLKIKDFFGKSNEVTRLDKAFQNVDNIFEDIANDQRAKIPETVRNKIINNTEGNFDTDEALEEVGKFFSLGPSFIKLSKKEKEKLVTAIKRKFGEEVGNRLAFGLLKLLEDPLQDKRFKNESKNVGLNNNLGDPVVDFLNNGNKKKSEKDDAHLLFQKSSPAINSNSNESEVDRPPNSKKKNNK